MKYSNLYKNSLLNDVIPFWEKHSVDRQDGGFLSCLDRKGKVFDTDKFIWLQGRQAWMFSFLYNNVEQNDAWFAIAQNGIDFLIDHGRNTKGDFYFSTTKNGTPLVKAYNIFSDCFAAMAFAQFGKASNIQKYNDLARQTYYNILRRSKNPKGIFEKKTGNRALKSFSLPMILSNLVMELSDVLEPDEKEKTIDASIHAVMNEFLDRQSGLIFEHINLDGSFSNTFDGRLINPGHGLEAMWFMMDIAKQREDIELIEKCCDVMLNILEFGWDKEYGGIFYFLDIKGYPPQQLEWDQKLWWVHMEALIALSKGFLHTGRQDLEDWYSRVHNYTWTHFPDPEHGEWLGYLNRRGEPLLNLKGGKWKGCFHLPRGLYQCWKAFESIEQKNTNK